MKIYIYIIDYSLGCKDYYPKNGSFVVPIIASEK
jgi:hypothetical protein